MAENSVCYNPKMTTTNAKMPYLMKLAVEMCCSRLIRELYQRRMGEQNTIALIIASSRITTAQVTQVDDASSSVSSPVLLLW